MTLKIPITKPYFGPEEHQAIQKPLQSGWVVQGPYVAEFEAKFSAFSGSPYSAAVSSCNAALHIAMAALKLKPGDEVIVPALTWVSSANVVEYMGAKPVFCDIDPQTFNIDTSQIESLITSRTVGLNPVHLFGLCAEMNAIKAIAERHGLWVVEDAACALGARYQEQHAGTFGDLGCFSFHPRKSITTGEGGMISSSRPELDSLVRSLRDHGASRSDLARHNQKYSFLLADYDILGFNYRMTDMQGALGAVQMDRADWIIERRRELAQSYNQLLSGLEGITCPCCPAGHKHAYQAYVCLFTPERPTLKNCLTLATKRNQVMLRLEEAGISTRQGTHAVALTGYYSNKYGLRPEQFPQAYIAEQLSLALPLYPQLSREEQLMVVETLKEAMFH